MANDKPIKDGVYGYVSGTVGRSFQHKNGRAFELEVKDPKQQYGDKWTVWADLPVAEGDRVSVKGWLGISKGNYTKDGEQKTAIRRSVNSAELAAHEPNATPAATPPAADVWNAPGTTYSDESPF